MTKLEGWNHKKYKIDENMNDFPFEIYSIIVTFLDGISLLSFLKCSKGFYRIVQENKDIKWREILLTLYNIKNFRNPSCRFLSETFFTLGEIIQNLEVVFNFNMFRDFIFAKNLKEFQFGLPIDSMGSDIMDNIPFIAFPKKEIKDYRLITEKLAQKNIQEYEDHFKIESFEGYSVFEIFINEMNEGYKMVSPYEHQCLKKKNGNTLEKVEKFKTVEILFKNQGIQEVYYQKVHYYLDNGKYLFGEMVLYGVTKNNNIVGFSWIASNNL